MRNVVVNVDNTQPRRVSRNAGATDIGKRWRVMAFQRNGPLAPELLLMCCHHGGSVIVAIRAGGFVMNDEGQ